MVCLEEGQHAAAGLHAAPRRPVFYGFVLHAAEKQKDVSRSLQTSNHRHSQRAANFSFNFFLLQQICFQDPKPDR